MKGPRLILFKDGDFNSSDETDGVTQANEKDKTIDFLGIGGAIIFSVLLCFVLLALVLQLLICSNHGFQERSTKVGKNKL